MLILILIRLSEKLLEKCDMWIPNTDLMQIRVV